jgi:hypothetical protein
MKKISIARAREIEKVAAQRLGVDLAPLRSRSRLKRPPDLPPGQRFLTGFERQQFSPGKTL